MKVGDIITVTGPNGLVSGIVMHVESMKTRSGWTATIEHVLPNEPHRFMLRPESEGSTWMYGEDQKAKDALLVSHALGEHTVVAPLKHLIGKRITIKMRKKGSV